MITDDELKQWRELAEKATPGPWEYGGHMSRGIRLVWTESLGTTKFDTAWIPAYNQDANGQFIAASRIALPRLIAELEAVKAELEAVKADRDSETKWAGQYHTEAEQLKAVVNSLRLELEDLGEDYRKVHKWHDEDHAKVDELKAELEASDKEITRQEIRWKDSLKVEGRAIAGLSADLETARTYVAVLFDCVTDDNFCTLVEAGKLDGIRAWLEGK